MSAASLDVRRREGEAVAGCEPLRLDRSEVERESIVSSGSGIRWRHDTKSVETNPLDVSVNSRRARRAMRYEKFWMFAPQRRLFASS